MRLSSGGAIEFRKQSSVDEDQLSLASLSPQMRQQDGKLLEHIITMYLIFKFVSSLVILLNFIYL